jgi:4-amino-4-deoxy-L-arabinose transferase-like glycosyltransferase
MIADKFKNKFDILYISVIILILFRLLLTFAIPLLDKTEARYAEIARIMWDTNQWIVPQIDYGVPFMAKPPLSSWLSAGSYIIFGINEFASRLPSLLLNVLILVITGKIVKKTGLSFYLPGFILLTMPEFLIHTGVVSTDTAFAFCTTMVMIAFWKTMNSPQKTYWNYLFFVFLGLGLLAKGPLVLMLTLPPVFLWCVLDTKRFKELFSKFSMIIGTLIVTVIAAPWYYLAEQKAPGFLDYFIIGEHYKRFVESGWKGDLYGKPKSQPLGMIWLFMIAFGFPWIQIVFYKLWKNKKTIFKNSWISFLFLWLFWTPVFFTFSRNILHTYMLPITVPIMFLMVYYWEDFKSKKQIFRVALVFPLIVFIAYFAVFSTGKLENYMNTDKYMLENLKVNSENIQVPLFYWKEKNYSGQFYSDGKAQLIKNESQFDSVFKIHKKIFLVILKKREYEISKKYIDQMVLTESNYKTSIFVSK